MNAFTLHGMNLLFFFEISKIILRAFSIRLFLRTIYNIRPRRLINEDHDRFQSRFADNNSRQRAFSQEIAGFGEDPARMALGEFV